MSNVVVTMPTFLVLFLVLFLACVPCACAIPLGMAVAHASWIAAVAVEVEVAEVAVEAVVAVVAVVAEAAVEVVRHRWSA